MADLFAGMAQVPDIADQIACIERELSFRKRCYPRWVKDGKLTQEASDLELERMRAVLATLLGAQPVMPAEVELAVRVERERVLGICGRHIESSRFLRVTAEVRRTTDQIDAGMKAAPAKGKK